MGYLFLFVAIFYFRYVCLIESQLCDSLTLHQRGEDGRYCARISGAKHSPSDVFLPPHLYGQLTQHEAGFNTLKQDENIQKLIKVSFNLLFIIIFFISR